MRTLTSTLLAAQKAPSRTPYVKVAAANKIAGVVRYDWTRLYTGSEDDYFHAMTMPGDGSLIRARITLPADSRKLYRQRVTAPGPSSDFSTWTYTGQYDCIVVAAASLGAEVSIFWINSTSQIQRLKSTDYGATWEGPELIDYSPTTAINGLAATYKPNGDLAIFFADQATLYVKKCLGGAWQTKTTWDKTTGDLSGVGAVYGSDWNLLVTGKDVAGSFKLWTLVYGDGGDVAPGAWSPLKEFASAPSGGGFDYLRVFMDRPDVYRCFYVEKFGGTEAYTRPFWSHSVADTAFVDSLWREPVPFDLSSQYGLALAHYGDYCWLSCPAGVWHAKLTVQTLDLTADVGGVKQDVSPTEGKLTVELRNDDGRYASPEQGSLNVLSIGCQIDFSPGYITARATEILRPSATGDETNILMQVPGSGEHWDKVDEEVADGNTTRLQDYRAVYQRDLYQIQEPALNLGSISSVRVYALCRSAALPNQANLKIVCKSGGIVSESPEITVSYDLQVFTRYYHEWAVNPATGSAWSAADITNLQAGVALRSPKSGVDEWTLCTQVFVEVDHGGVGEASSGQTFSLHAYEHTSSGGRATLVLYASDAWRALADWRARHQFRWNKASAEMSVKDILAFVLSRVGLKLTVVSQSSVITSFYPDFTISPGDAGEAVVRKLLSFVPDVILIEGSRAYLVNPQATDSSVYSYGGTHSILEGRYRRMAGEVNRVQVEGRDGSGEPIIVDSFSWDEIRRVYDRFQQVEDRNIDTVTEAQQRGQAYLREAEIGSADGIVLVPVNCGQQLYDVTDVTDQRAGLTSEKKRVLGLATVYEPRRGEYIQRLRLGSV